MTSVEAIWSPRKQVKMNASDRSHADMRRVITKTTTIDMKDALPLTAEEVRLMNAYWRAANYLSVGQIYLYDNPLLREPLKLEHVKRRLLGHWGTTPGLNFVYVHVNRFPSPCAPCLHATSWVQQAASHTKPSRSGDAGRARPPGSCLPG